MQIPRIKLDNPEELSSFLTPIIKAGRFIEGQEHTNFAQKLRSIFKQNYVILTSNGFSSLFLSLKSLGIKNKKVLLPAISTCFAMTNAIKASENIPIFCDVDLKTGNIDIEAAITVCKNENIEIILSPNHFGILSEVNELKKICKYVIEDCAQSFLSSSQNNTSLTDIRVLSFYPTKLINGIDGGAILTNLPEIGNYCSKNIYYSYQNYKSTETIFNIRMTNLHAATGLFFLSRMEYYRQKLKKIANRYRLVLLNNENIHLLGSPDHILQKAVLTFADQDTRNFAKKYFLKEGIQAFEEFVPLVAINNQYSKSKQLLETNLSLPLYPTLTNKEVNYICQKLEHLSNII